MGLTKEGRKEFLAYNKELYEETIKLSDEHMAVFFKCKKGIKARFVQLTNELKDEAVKLP